MEKPNKSEYQPPDLKDLGATGSELLPEDLEAVSGGGLQCSAGGIISNIECNTGREHIVRSK